MLENERGQAATVDPIVVPALIALDDTTAQAIDQHRGKGGSFIVEGRLYLDRSEDGGRQPLHVRLVAKHVVFVDDEAIEG